MAVLSPFAAARARQTLKSAGLEFDGELEAASSTSNEIHLSERYVIRVSANNNSRRLQREAQLYPFLPDHPWSPTLVASGVRSGCDFVIVERKRGQPLGHCWPFISPDARRSAVADLADCLRALHQTPTPRSSELAPLDESLYLLAGEADDVAHDDGTDQLRLTAPLSGQQRVEPLLAGLDRLGDDPNADGGIVDMAREYVNEHCHVLDDYDASRLIHGDLTFENLLHHDDGISAVVDFEWCRGGPPELDLDVLLRCCAFPAAHVAHQFAPRSRPEDYADIPVWLAEDYPELFDAAQLRERLTLLSLAFDVRQALEAPLPERRSDDDVHPYNRLIALLSIGGHVAQLLDRVGYSAEPSGMSSGS